MPRQLLVLFLLTVSCPVGVCAFLGSQTTITTRRKPHPVAFRLASSSVSAETPVTTVTETNEQKQLNLLSSKKDRKFFENEVLPNALSNIHALMDPLFLELCCSPDVQDTFEACCGAVHVDTSSIPEAGRGLFASKDLKAGTIVSWYPVHALCVNYANGGSILLSAADEQDEDCWDYTNSDYSLNLLGNRPLLGWKLDVGKDDRQHKIMVDANPQQTVPPAWRAHYINDGSIIQENSIEAIEQYYDNALKKMNAVLVPFGPSPICVAVTTRDVDKGEELFTAYGYSYWMNRFEQPWAEKTDEIVAMEMTVVEKVEIATETVQVTYRQQGEELEEHFANLTE